MPTRLLLFAVPVVCLLTAAGFAESVAVPGFARLKEKIDAGEQVTVVYLGGSITNGAMTWPQHGTNRDGETYDFRSESHPDESSWRARTFAWLKQHYEKTPGQFRMVNAAIGATDSELGAYRLADHVLANKPDLLVVEYAINDGGRGMLSNDRNAPRSIYRTMASIVTRVQAANPEAAIFIPVSTARDLDPTRNEGFQVARAHHLRFADEHRIPYVDIHRVFFEEPLPEGITPENVFDGPDNPGCAVHPSPKGHQAYAAGVCRRLKELLESRPFPFAGEAAPGWPTPYPVNPKMVAAASLPEGEGWALREGTAFAGREDHVLAETPILFTSTERARLTMRFRGTAVFAWGQHHYPDGDITGRLVVRIDGVDRAVFTDAAHRQGTEGLLQRMLPVAHDLDPAKEHLLELVTEPRADGSPTRIGLHGVAFDTP